MATKKKSWWQKWWGPLLVSAAVYIPVGVGIALLLFNPFTWPFAIPVAILSGLFSPPIAGLIGTGIVLGISLLGAALVRFFVFVFEKTCGKAPETLQEKNPDPSVAPDVEPKTTVRQVQQRLTSPSLSSSDSTSTESNEASPRKEFREALKEFNAIDTEKSAWRSEVGKVRDKIVAVLSDQANQKMALEELERKVKKSREEFAEKVNRKEKTAKEAGEELLDLMMKLIFLFHPDKCGGVELANEAMKKILDWREEIQEELKGKLSDEDLQTMLDNIKKKQAALGEGFAEIRAGQAEIRAGHAEIRAGHAEIRADHAEIRAGQAEIREEQVEIGAGFDKITKMKEKIEEDAEAIREALRQREAQGQQEQVVATSSTHQTSTFGR